MDESINKMRYIHKMEYYSFLKQKGILTYMTGQMNCEDIMLGEINQTHEDQYCMIPLV